MIAAISRVYRTLVVAGRTSPLADERERLHDAAARRARLAVLSLLAAYRIDPTELPDAGACATLAEARGLWALVVEHLRGQLALDLAALAMDAGEARRLRAEAQAVARLEEVASLAWDGAVAGERYPDDSHATGAP